MGGGWGAAATRDGLDAMYSASHGDTFNCLVGFAKRAMGSMSCTSN
jgi:N-methylhydantoinase B